MGCFAQAPFIDVLQAFGPMASMHAALDAAGAGAPCAISAVLVDATREEAADAVSRACQTLPVLRSFWCPAPRLGLITSEDPPEPCGVAAPAFTLCAEEGRPPWRYALRPHPQGILFEAAFLHAAADGLSMLRLVRGVADVLAGRPTLAYAPPAARTLQLRSQPVWMARFLVDQLLATSNVAEASHPPSVVAASYLRLTPAQAEQVLASARVFDVGPVAMLAMSALLALRSTRGEDAASAMINIPVARRDLGPTGGFGYGVGSLLFPMRVEGRETAASLSQRIHARVQTQLREGFDLSLERFLSADPIRHRRFAERQIGRKPSQLTVSWKGRRELGARVRDAACFGATPGLHVSAHVDDAGMAISVTAPRPPAWRDAFLTTLAKSLGVEGYDLREFGTGLIADASANWALAKA